MSADEFIVWSSDEDDPARAELAQARAVIAASSYLQITRQSGSDDAPRRILVIGDETSLRTTLQPFASVRIEQNLRMKPTRGEDV